MTEEIAERVRAIAAEVFGEDIETLTSLTERGVLESWDSLAQLNLMLALEDEFAIHLAPEDIERMNTLGAVADLVSERVK
jgi:acyl carrier protein